MHLGLQHSYLALPPRFYATVRPSPVPEPRLIVFNRPLAQELGMDVVAEGAETESEAIELYQMGCDYAQGFAFGEAMTPSQARRLVGAALEAA